MRNLLVDLYNDLKAVFPNNTITFNKAHITLQYENTFDINEFIQFETYKIVIIGNHTYIANRHNCVFWDIPMFDLEYPLITTKRRYFMKVAISLAQFFEDGWK